MIRIRTFCRTFCLCLAGGALAAFALWANGADAERITVHTPTPKVNVHALKPHTPNSGQPKEDKTVQDPDQSLNPQPLPPRVHPKE